MKNHKTIGVNQIDRYKEQLQQATIHIIIYAVGGSDGYSGSSK